MEPIVESRKYFMGCNIAGFAYGEGCIVMDEVKVGTQVQLVRDNYNKFDPLAIAIYYKNSKLGYIPHDKNNLLALFLDMDYNDIFEVRISRLNPNAHPEKQVYINIYLKRNVR